ncbi:MAG: hypothetical protein U1D67_05220, partial [Dehalococcoidia bacterium]|nr:hypothetical protein [Dehalococcoidia bacterium]
MNRPGEVLRLSRDIVEGRILIPKQFQGDWGRTNNSMLKGWAIKEDRSEAAMLPHILWATGAKLLGRSYSEMGAAFKAKALAFISGDECADIQELWGFTNVTLLPRLVSLRGILHFVGTVQAEGYDYLRMIEMAEEDMLRPDWKENGMYFVQKGTMYNNPFLDQKEVEATERIA